MDLEYSPLTPHPLTPHSVSSIDSIPGCDGWFGPTYFWIVHEPDAGSYCLQNDDRSDVDT